MDAAKIQAEFDNLKKKYEGFGDLAVLSKDGKILFQTNPAMPTAQEAVHIMESWLGTKPAIEVAGIRYAILKWDPIQFASRSVASKTAIVGSITKAGNYGLIRTTPACQEPLIECSVILNRFSWNLY
jgi:hypothetical protein